MNITKALLSWYRRHGRHDLPWQTGQPYHVWLSEVMLQQTQVATVIPYFQRFIQHFPTIQTLAAAEQDQVLALWAGLGYYSRARNLHKTAQRIVEVYQGKFPADIQQLMSLPGIGRSTAGAIAALSLKLRAPILDGNVKRVLSRLYCIEGWYGDKQVEKQLWQLAERHTPQKAFADYTQAIMDLGAMVCTRSQPQCQQCPLSKYCQAHQQQRTAEFPHKKPKKAKPRRHIQWLICSLQDGQILLEQVQERLWGGLWIFPQCDLNDDPFVYLQQHYQVVPEAQQRLPVLQHSFTHFDLHIEPTLFLLPQAPTKQGRPQRWIDLTQVDTLAIPAPVKKVLKRLQ